MKVQFQAFYTVFAVVWPYVQTAIRIWMTIMQPLQDLVIGVLSAISLVLKGDFLGAWDTVKNAVLTFFSTINTAVADFANDIIGKISRVISSLASEATKVGNAIANGIADGISNAKDAVIRALIGACNSAIDAAKKLLGIASPSILMAETIGKPFSQGIAAGIVSGIPDIAGASRLAGAVAGTQATTNNYYQLSATYNSNQSESSIMMDLRDMQRLAGA
jgi:phage-related protein